MGCVNIRLKTIILINYLSITHTDRQVTQILFQRWRIENCKYSFCIYFVDQPHSNG